MMKHVCHVLSFDLIKIMDNTVQMNVKICMFSFFFFLIAVSNISFYHFSPLLIHVGSVTKHLQKSENNSKQPISTMEIDIPRESPQPCLAVI